MAKKIVDTTAARTYYISHPDCSLKELSKKFNIGVDTLNKRSVEEGWVQKQLEYKDELQEALLQKSKEEEFERRVQANKLHNEMYDKLLNAASSLIKQFEEAESSGKFNRATTAANLAYLADVVQKAQKGQRTALNMDKEEEQDTSPKVKFVIEGITLEDI